MAATDWTAFELLAEGWEKYTVDTPAGDMYARGVTLCAKQLRETIARAKQDEEDA